MSQLMVMIVRVDDLDKPEQLSEVWRQPVAEINPGELEAERLLDRLEGQVSETGWALMRRLLVEQWRAVDEALVSAYCAQQGEAAVVAKDGHDPLKVASRFGVVQLPRQVCYDPGRECHVLPGNEGLPAHQGQVTTRGLQEWLCLLPQEVPFGTAQRLLGWLTRDPEVVSETQLRRWVSRHGQLIRQAEQAEVEALQAQGDLSHFQACLAPLSEPRRPPAWPAELDAAVQARLAQPEAPAPEGVSAADWERVCQAHQAETPIEQLRRLGPTLQPGEIVASTDDVGVRRPPKRRWLELRTACVRTAQGYRYLSGSAEAVLQQLYVLLILCGGLSAKLTLLGDGARWIGTFFLKRLAAWPASELIVDWYHLAKKCYELTSLICRGRQAKKKLLGPLLYRLWRGQVDEALALLESARPEAKDPERLEQLITYLSERRAYLPDYRARRAQRRYIGSAHTEKANDLIVARRQKHRGMHWERPCSDGLAALRTLLLNGGWDLYWQEYRVLPLAVPKEA